MYILVEGAGVELVEAENFRGFSVVVEGDVELRGALEGVGVVDAAGEHVFVEVEGLTGLAGERATAEWVEGLGKMVEFARSKGWVDDAGRVRAHVERREAQAG